MFTLYIFLSLFAGWAISYSHCCFHSNWKHTSSTTIALLFNWSLFVSLSVFISCLVINVVRIEKKRIRAGKEFSRFSDFYKSKVFKNIILFFFVCIATIYMGQRIRWTGSDNANLEAKEYFVAGQVLQGFRLLLTSYIHPEIFILQPLNQLQHHIYTKGIRYLPENDGEQAAWKNRWFHYHYNRRHRIALMDKLSKPSERTIHLLDDWWLALESMATKPFADRQMEEIHYYQSYSVAVLSYTLLEGLSTGHIAVSGGRMAKLQLHVTRSRLLVQWLNELRKKWSTSPDTQQFLKSSPKQLAIFQYVLLCELRDVIRGDIHSREFSCDSPFVKQYVHVRKEFVAPENGLPAYKQMKDKVAAKTLYDWAVNNQSSMRYVLEHYCGYDVAGEEDMSYYETIGYVSKGKTPAEEYEDRVKRNYSEEIKILEEMFRGK